jgi:hypothetical protein
MGFHFGAERHRQARLLSRSPVSGIGEPIEIANHVGQPRLDGSRCHSFCCPARFSGFLAIVSSMLHP